MNDPDQMSDSDVKRLLKTDCVNLMRTVELPDGEWGAVESAEISDLIAHWESGNYRVDVSYVDGDDELACWDIKFSPESSDAAGRLYNAAVPMKNGQVIRSKPL